jgi:uncharacterized protein YjbJ (UPF0337 family)
MDWNSAAGDWHQVKRSVQRRWSRLADDDLDQVAGQRELLIVRLQELYGFTPAEVEAELRDWERHQDPIFPAAGPPAHHPSPRAGSALPSMTAGVRLTTLRTREAGCRASAG